MIRYLIMDQPAYIARLPAGMVSLKSKLTVVLASTNQPSLRHSLGTRGYLSPAAEALRRATMALTSATAESVWP